MKFSIGLSKLLEILSCLGNVAKLKVDEVDGYVLLDVEKDSVYFLSNSGTRAIDAIVTDFEFIEEGRCAIPYGKINSFINSFRYIKDSIKQVDFSLNTNGLEVAIVNLDGKKFSSTVLEIASHHIITIPSPMEDTSFIINSNIIKILLSKTQFSIDNNHVMEYLQSVYMKFHNGMVYLVGTDGVVLSEVITSSPTDLSSGSYLVPISFFSKVPNFVKSDTPLLFSINNNMIKMKCGDICYHGLLVINSGFPENYNGFLDKFKYTLEVNVTTFMAGVSAVLAALDSDADLKLKLTFGDDHVNIKSMVSEFDLDIVAKDVEFDEVEVSIDGSILLKALKTFGRSDNIKIKFTDSNSPVILYGNNIVEHNVAIAHIKG